ncbi:thermonuclease family protein [Anabaena sp. FACHB-1237]|uniref:thermonuclease family protein n=1 Tax=Anabaena sp. FACHB-1237 TaxID=2692769 RepID=UPI001680FD2B|nr:thermonuclease family protein [Anabaena sp. FACHB-1237]MBD2138766.1 thermonuclease family protein [Anabaena sp. FACHB-1237]
MNKLVRKTLIYLGVGLMIFGLMACNQVLSNSGDMVEKVSDGDTIVVTDSQGQKITVRFACVDAPEIPHSQKEKTSKRLKDVNQFSWGLRAQVRVEKLVKESKNHVILNITDSDRYHRKVAEVRLQNGTLIQEVLLKEGLTKVYPPYLNKCPSKDVILAAQAQAQQQKRGIWDDPEFIDPWKFRK